jgi:hypothetical protein
VTGIIVTVTAPFSRPSGSAGGTCTTTLAINGSCTINIVFSPSGAGAAAGTVNVSASVPVGGLPVSLSGTGLAAPSLPSLTVLDNFNRANASNLGSNWTQLNIFGTAGITVNDVTSGNTSTGTAFCTGTLCVAGANAYWTSAFGSKQSAAFTIASTTASGDSVALAGSNYIALTGSETNFVRVRWNGTAVDVQTTTNAALTYTTAATLTGTFANGDTITALLDGTTAPATVWVWKTTSGNVTTSLGSAQLPNATTWTGGGVIGMQLPTGARVDNFAGGNVP